MCRKSTRFCLLLGLAPAQQCQHASRQSVGAAATRLISPDAAAMICGDIAAALVAMDRALCDQPDVTYEDLVEAIRRLIRLRDKLIDERRRGRMVGDQLARLNAVVSLVVAAEYPLEGERRERVEAARRELASIPLAP